MNAQIVTPYTIPKKVTEEQFMSAIESLAIDIELEFLETSPSTRKYAVAKMIIFRHWLNMNTYLTFEDDLEQLEVLRYYFMEIENQRIRKQRGNQNE